MHDDPTGSDRRRLLEEIFERELGPDWENNPVEPVGPWEALAILWPLNAAIRAAGFISASPRDVDETLEARADAAIAAWCRGERPDFLPMDDPETAAAVAARHISIMAVLCANEAAGEPAVAFLPRGLREDAKRRALVAWFHFRSRPDRR